jgi:uncharacterized membrane protein YhfC
MDVALRGLAALLMIALPLSLGVYLTRRWQQGWGLALVGVATFLLSQIGHLPFNSLALNPILVRLGFGTSVGSQPIGALALSSLLLGVSAGLFEEGARYLVLRFWIRRARTYRQGVLFGLGHGGAEAIIIGVLALLQLSQAYALRGQDLSVVVPADQLAAAQAQLQAYWAVPASVFLLSTVERASALVIQLALTILVLQAFLRRRGGLWWLAAVGWHAAVDGSAVFTGVLWGTYQGSMAGTVASEVLVAGLAVVSLFLLLRLRPTASEEPPTPLPPVNSPPPPAGPSLRPDRLDDTRYTSSG